MSFKPFDSFTSNPTPCFPLHDHGGVDGALKLEEAKKRLEELGA
jgi:hypothetical protein